MKYSEGLFKFPIRIYDHVSLAKTILKEEKKLRDVIDEDDIDELIPEDTDWALGYARIPIKEIKAWMDSFPDGKNPKVVAEEGFEETSVLTHTLGDFLCLWNMEKFEKELDTFVERYTAGIDKMVETAFEEKRAATPQKKKGFWNYRKL